ELQDHRGPLALRSRPWGMAAAARVHQRMERAGDESVVDEEVFLDAEVVVAALQIAGTIILDPVSQCQVLRARRRTNRVGLHEAQFLERQFERRRGEHRMADGEVPEMVEGNRHANGRPTSTPAVCVWCWHCVRS